MTTPHVQRTPQFVQHQFVDAGQQHSAYEFGMWIFLATELLFFGGMFTGYVIYRMEYTHVFHEASRDLDLWLGTLNTALLLGSSLTMALSVRSLQVDRPRASCLLLLVTTVLGVAFLGVKGYEYYHHFLKGEMPGFNFQHPGEDARQFELFFSLYFILTGVHALHLTIGIGTALLMAIGIRWRRVHAGHSIPLELTGLYWHFVDIIWIFLFPLFYLMGYPQ